MVSKGRILALDYGEKNIGLACTDELGLTVQPLPSIQNPGKRGLIKRLRAIIQDMGVQKIVLGIPINMDGTRGDAAIRMEKLQESLKSGLNIQLVGVEETLSTVEAMEFLLSKMQGSRSNKSFLDSMSV